MSDFYRFPQPNNTFHQEAVTISTQLLIDEARTQDYTVRIPVGTRLVKFSKGERTATIHAQIPDATTAIGAYATEDKAMCRSLLMDAGIQVPHGFSIRREQSQEEYLKVFQSLHQPVVIKPTHGTKGESVFMNVTTAEEYLAAVQICFLNPPTEGAGVVVEEQFPGKEYRIVATRTEVLAIANRVPANVTGDGTSTIQNLIDKKNADPRRNDPLGGLFPIRIDTIVRSTLKNFNLSLDSIPKMGETISLRLNSNISTGGDSIDVTDEAHASVKELAIRAVNAIPGLAFAGVDFLTTDIMAEQTASSYVIIELNKSPGFFLHELPYQGKKRSVSKALLSLLFS